MLHRFLLLVLLTLATPPALADALKVGVSPDYPPLAFQQDGRIMGIEADNVRAVSEVIGRQMKLVPVRFD